MAGQRVTVGGAARSGVAAAELLAAKGARVTVSEARSSVPERERLESLGIRVAAGGNDPALFTNADLIVLSPGVPVESPFLDEARRSGIPIIGELELASRWLRGRVIAITGTKGKSTTTTLTGLMLDAAGFRTRVAGNIGTPLQRARERFDGRHAPRRRGQQLSARDDRAVSPVDRCGAESVARPPRSPPDGGRVRRREGTDLREPGSRRLGCRQCGRRGGAGARRAKYREAPLVRIRRCD